MCAAVPTIKASADFQRISRQGKKWTFPAFIFQALRSEGDAPFRLGLTVSRKVGNAVVRNRAKRRLREMVRLAAPQPRLAGWSIVLIGRTAAAERDFALMTEDFRRALKNLGVEA